jgi:hypothetical protein
MSISNDTEEIDLEEDIVRENRRQIVSSSFANNEIRDKNYIYP